MPQERPNKWQKTKKKKKRSRTQPLLASSLATILTQSHQSLHLDSCPQLASLPLTSVCSVLTADRMELKSKPDYVSALLCTLQRPLPARNQTQSLGVPAVAQRDWRHFGSTRTQGSPAQWIRIPRCCRCDLGQDCGLNLIPGLGTPYALGWPKKKKNQKTKHHRFPSWRSGNESD